MGLHIAQASLQFTLFLRLPFNFPVPPECWGYRQVLLCPLKPIQFFKGLPPKFKFLKRKKMPKHKTNRGLPNMIQGLPGYR